MAVGAENPHVFRLVLAGIAFNVIQFKGDRGTHPLSTPAHHALMPVFADHVSFDS